MGHSEFHDFSDFVVRQPTLQRMASLDWPPTVQVKSVNGQPPLVISDIAYGESVSRESTL